MDDVNKPVSCLRVAQARPKRRVIVSVVSLFAALGAVWLVCVPRTHSAVAKTVKAELIDADYHQSLQQNMHVLEAVSNKRIIHEDDRYNKELLARNNAPTTLYRAQSASKGAGTRVFMQHSTLTQFANAAAGVAAVSAVKLPHLSYLIVAGEIIKAVLETAISSDLPGMVRAIVTQPVYAYKGQRLLIPRGSRLIGQYHTVTRQTQQRVMVIWTRLLLPDGVAIMVNSPSSDAMGRSGQAADSINRHFVSQFSRASLLSLLGAGSATVGVANNDQYNSVAQYRGAVAQSFSQSAQQSLAQNGQPQPTLMVHAGALIHVFVARDLDFYHAVSL